MLSLNNNDLKYYPISIDDRYDNIIDNKMIPSATNYLIDMDKLSIDSVYTNPSKSVIPMGVHMILNGITDDCYVWFTVSQYETISIRE